MRPFLETRLRERERQRQAEKERERDRQRGRGSGESLHRLRPVFARFLKTDRAFPIKGATRVACTPGVTIGYRDTPRKTIAGRPCSVAHRLFTLAPLRGNDRPSIERAFHPPRYENRADQRRNLVSILSISRSRAPNYSRDTHAHTRLEQQSRKRRSQFLRIAIKREDFFFLTMKSNSRFSKSISGLNWIYGQKEIFERKKK